MTFSCTSRSRPVPHFEQAGLRRSRGRLRVERLEDRSVPTVFTVTTAAMNLDLDGKVSLWEAIGAANLNVPFGDAPAGSPGLDTIRFAPGLNGQTIVYPAAITSDGLAFTEDLTIVGPGAGLLTISGNDIARIFRVNPFGLPDVDVQIRGLTLTHGYSSGDGGAILNWGNLSLSDVTVASNVALNYGGGIYNSGNLTITNSTIGRSSAGNRGGGIYNTGDLKVATSRFHSNSATTSGGGIDNEGTLTLKNSSLSANTTNQFGGGIVNDGNMEVTDSAISGNTAQKGGGAYIAFASPATLTNSMIIANTASEIGGGIFSSVFPLSVTNCCLVGNVAVAGGGIFADGDLTVTNSTITGNSCASDGGGLDVASNLIVTNSTITGNSAGEGGGIAAGALGNSATIIGSIVAGNRADVSGPDLGVGTFSLSFSLIQKLGGFTIAESAPGTNLFGLDPLLGPLAYNGGPTLTHALLPGSPALDRGWNSSALTEDQRGYGYERVIGAAADIGAYESHDSDVRLVPDPLNFGRNVLVVVGTRRSDTICFRLDDGDVDAVLNGKHHAFDPMAVDRVVAFGMEGNDKIKSTLAVGAVLDGGRGADTLTGGSGVDILMGGAGADVLAGGGARDLLIGGDGIDRLTGGADDDLLVGGRTLYDQDHLALSQILAEWTSADEYTTRAANLLAGTGVPALGAAQITDAYTDVLVSDAGLELIYTGPGDQVRNRVAAESAVNVNGP